MSDRATVEDIRRVLLDGAHYTDATLVDLVRRILARSGSWSDADDNAFRARREVFTVAEHPDLLAFDGSNEPQKRRLTGRDRDVLTRLVVRAAFDARREIEIGDEGEHTHLGPLLALGRDNPAQLDELAWVLDPREP